MAILDKSMGALDPNDVEGSMTRVQNYIYYMQECFEFYNNTVANQLTALEARIAELEG